jgi:hypothetical protein
MTEEENKQKAEAEAFHEKISGILNEHNCKIEGSIVIRAAGNEDLIAIVPFMVAGESEDDRKARGEKCSKAIEEAMKNGPFVMRSAVSVGQNGVRSVIELIDKSEKDKDTPEE